MFDLDSIAKLIHDYNVDCKNKRLTPENFHKCPLCRQLAKQVLLQISYDIQHIVYPK